MEDNGYSSRKFILTLTTMGCIVVSGIFLKEAVLSTVIVGLLGALGTYCGVNLGMNWLGVKKDVALQTGDVSVTVDTPKDK